MKYTSSHWGTYKLRGHAGIEPLPDDPQPSRIGKGWVSAAQDRSSRIVSPVIRQGWLQGDKGQGRNSDRFVEVSWDLATALAAGEIKRVAAEHGNGAIYGGSYGWASAGRFHHAQSQLRRFLNLAGGFVASVGTYSHAAAEVLFPHIVGLSNRAFLDQMTSLELVAEHCEYLLAFGGISTRTAQISAAGVSRHDVGQTLERLHERGAKVINISPRGRDQQDAQWLSIRPGTDTALLLALSYEIVIAKQADEVFLAKYTSGWPEWRAYLLGTDDGIPKSAAWAAELCEIPAEQIQEMAQALVARKSIISVNWGMQRAEYGEQVLWAALGLACIIGQIGQPGTGFSFGYGSTTPVGSAAKWIDWPSVPQGDNPVTDFIPVARIADMLLNPGGRYEYDGQSRQYPDIRLVYWCGGNPFHHHQDLNRLEQAWRVPETVIVQDHTWGATARRADIVLPATTPLERSDFMMNRRDASLFYMSPLFDPLGAAKDDYEIFQGLAQELGFEQAFTEGRTSQDWLERLWSQATDVAHAAGFKLPSFERFKTVGRFDVPDAAEQHIAFADFVADPDHAPLATESGKITLHNKTVAGFAARGCPGYPVWQAPQENLLNAKPGQLHLISGQPDTRLHSQNDRGSEALADKIQGREPADIHPETAAELGLSQGQVMRIWNDRGSCLAGVRFDTEIRRDCIALATGAWFDPQIVDGEPLEVHGNPNVLTIDRGCSELSQGNMAHTALVWVDAWGGDLPALSIDQPPEIKRKGHTTGRGVGGVT